MKLLSAIQIPKTRVIMLNRLRKLDQSNSLPYNKKSGFWLGNLNFDRKVKLKGSFVLGFLIITKSKDN